MKSLPEFKVVTYQNDWLDTNTTPTIDFSIDKAIEAGVNIMVIAFWDFDVPTNTLTPSGGMAAAYNCEWVDYERINSLYHDGNINVLLGMGGETGAEADWSVIIEGNAYEYAKNAVDIIQDKGFDGIDIDWEGMSGWKRGQPYSNETYEGIFKFMEEFIVNLHTIFVDRGIEDKMIISCAPETAYLLDEYQNNPTTINYFWVIVDSNASQYIDYASIQFYNISDEEKYATNTYKTLFIESNPQEGWDLVSAAKQLITRGFPQEKLVVGKMNLRGEGNSLLRDQDYIDMPELTEDVINAIKGVSGMLKWMGGIMIWQWWVQSTTSYYNEIELEATVEYFKDVNEFINNGTEPDPPPDNECEDCTENGLGYKCYIEGLADGSSGTHPCETCENCPVDDPGYVCGYMVGLEDGNNGRASCETCENCPIDDAGYVCGHDAGYEYGHDAGYDEGHAAGYDEGHAAGYDEGLEDGGDGRPSCNNCNLCPTDDNGYICGHDAGYEAGLEDRDEVNGKNYFGLAIVFISITFVLVVIIMVVGIYYYYYLKSKIEIEEN